MPLSAKEIAERYANRIVRVTVGKSSPAFDANGDEIKSFDAKIIGWKRSTLKDAMEYVAVEVLKPNSTKFAVKDFSTGYMWTVRDRNMKGYAKKLYPAEIELPSDNGSTYTPPSKSNKTIPEWPHKCNACGHPAQILAMAIDCSNPNCKHKYRSQSGLDLFLPKDVRDRLAKPKKV